jgi:flagellar biosynthesis chaperone FliJ
VKSFKFPLESALRWRKSMLTAEQEKLQRALVTHQRLQAEVRAIEAAKRGAVRSQLHSRALAGSDFRFMSAYLVGLQAKHVDLQLALTQSSQQVQRQQAACREAEQRVELLGTLKDKRHHEWKREVEAEVELLATESYLAKRSRDQKQ